MVEGRTHIPVINRERCGICHACSHACPAWVLDTLQYEKESLRGNVSRALKYYELPYGKKYFDNPPCVNACPLGQDIPQYLKAVAEGDFDSALEIILRTNPLPVVLGRVCLHPCMKACVRGSLEKSPDIRWVKYIAAIRGKPLKKEISKKENGWKVAIVGSGPAGLAAGAILAEHGVSVTIYERKPLPGGMLRYGLGEFDLPLSDLEKDINRIIQLGVEIKTGCEIENLLDIEAEFDAIIIATGAGETDSFFKNAIKKVDGIVDVIPFMEKVRTDEIKKIQGEIVVEGFTPWAVTAARSALRIGAQKVIIISPFPVNEEIFMKAVDEGVEIIAPARVLDFETKSGKLESIKYAILSHKKIDQRGRIFDEKVIATRKIKVKMYIYAGQRLSQSSFFKNVSIKKGVAGNILVDKDSLKTSYPKVFAAGEAVTGGRSVISAVAMGVKAGNSVIEFLKKETCQDGR